jgi:D-aminopeptidase
MNNLITDVEGVLVGSADDAALASGVTVVMFETPAVASIAIHGGAPGVRDTACLEPEMAVPAVDALALSGGSAFGLDAAGGVQAWLREQGRGYPLGAFRIPIVPGAIVIDLNNGGDKNWGRRPPYWDLGYEAASRAGVSFELGTAGAGFGATTYDLKGGLGSASARAASGHRVGAIVAVNAIGRATRGRSGHFWAAPLERDDEFGGLGEGPPRPAEALEMRIKGEARANSTIGVVATDAPFSKSEMKRIAIMAHDGYALALRPTHAPLDGDVIFAASTGRGAGRPSLTELTEVGMLAADCMARAIARAVYEASALPGLAPPSWRDVHGRATPPPR